jgi:hypothetical protein
MISMTTGVALRYLLMNARMVDQDNSANGILRERFDGV